MQEIFGDVYWSDVKGRPVWLRARVTTASPLGLTVEGDTEPIGVPPTVLAHVGTLAAGDVVHVRVNPGGAVVVEGKEV